MVKIGCSAVLMIALFVSPSGISLSHDAKFICMTIALALLAFGIDEVRNKI